MSEFIPVILFFISLPFIFKFAGWWAEKGDWYEENKYPPLPGEDRIRYED